MQVSCLLLDVEPSVLGGRWARVLAPGQYNAPLIYGRPRPPPLPPRTLLPAAYEYWWKCPAQTAPSGLPGEQYVVHGPAEIIMST